MERVLEKWRGSECRWRGCWELGEGAAEAD